MLVFYVLCRASYGHIWCGFIPSAVWGFCNKFSSSFRCWQLVLTREASSIFEFLLGVFGRHVEDYQASGYVWLSVCALGASVHPPYVHSSTIGLYVSHTSRRHLGGHLSGFKYIHMSIGSSTACQQLYDCRPVIPVDYHDYWSLAVSCMACFSSYIF